MTRAPATVPGPDPSGPRIPLVIDARRGVLGMSLFIATEAALFVMLFFAYFYLRHVDASWALHPPKLTYAIVMLLVLWSSSGVLWWGERQLARGRASRARLAVAGTIVLGLVFLVLQRYETLDRLKEVSPRTNAYGSIFYAITGLHGAHVVLGLLMLLFVVCLPEIGRGERPPHRPLRNAAMYWHFVDVVWVLIVAILYVAPQFTS